MARTNTEAEQRIAALEAELASVRSMLEKGTGPGALARQERERIARRDRNARIRALDPAAFVEAVRALPQHERAVGLQPDRALELVRACGNDHALRERLLAVFTDANTAEVSWAMFDPPARVRLTIAPSKAETIVQVPDVRITPDQAERAEAMGLPVRDKKLAGFNYVGSDGFSEILLADAFEVWKDLHPGIARVVQRTVKVEPVSVDESRAISRREWFDDGAKRAELPALP